VCDGEVRVEVGGDAVVAAGVERVGAAEECDGRVRAEGARDRGMCSGAISWRLRRMEETTRNFGAVVCFWSWHWR
jgi:hypothetical protein